MSHTCAICKKDTGKLLECSVCGDDVCTACHELCSVCGQWACHRHIICIYKKTQVCTDCYAKQLNRE